MNVAVWIVSGLLAAAYLFAGLNKATQPKTKLVGNLPWAEDFTPATIKFIGIVEVLGAIGLILPWLTGIAPVLTHTARRENHMDTTSTTTSSTTTSSAALFAALQASHQRLNGLLTTIPAEDVRQQAYPTEWSIAQVASHLGSQAETFLLTLDRRSTARLHPASRSSSRSGTGGTPKAPPTRSATR
jgi:hypothetical protein